MIRRMSRRKRVSMVLLTAIAVTWVAVRPSASASDPPGLNVYPVAQLLSRPPSSGIPVASGNAMFDLAVLAIAYPENAQQDQLISRFPATYYARDGGPVGKFQAQCTLTRIGPGVFLTAAHCFANRRLAITISTGGGRTVSARCAVPKNSPVRGNGTICSDDTATKTDVDLSADWALCYASDWNRLPSIKAEVLTAKATAVSIGDRLLVLGAGCNKPLRPEHDPNRPLTHGFPTVNAVIGNMPQVPNYFATGKTDWHSRKGDGPISYTPPQLCQGDSGGAVYTMSSLPSIEAPRKIVGVASRACQTETDDGYVQSGPSWISSTTTEAFWSFLKDWAKHNRNPEICGYNVSPDRAKVICRH